MNAKQKSFLYQFTWVGILLLTLGGLFLAVPLFLQLYPLQPEAITVRVNGVLQPPTESSVGMFRTVFWLAFGISGAGLAAGAGSSCSVPPHTAALRFACGRKGSASTRWRMAMWPPTCMSTTARLCACAVPTPHRTAKFTSSKAARCVWIPPPYLQQNLVKVYYDHSSMKRYFVDVDGSAGLGERVFEL